MTIKELYEKACEEGFENRQIGIQFRDDGGDYYGWDDNVYCDLKTKKDLVLL